MHGGLAARVMLANCTSLHHRRDDLLDQGLLAQLRLVRTHLGPRSLRPLRLVCVAHHRDASRRYGTCSQAVFVGPCSPGVGDAATIVRNVARAPSDGSSLASAGGVERRTGADACVANLPAEIGSRRAGQSP